MHDWQKQFVATIAGMDPKELKITMTGRNVGKSMLSQQAIDRLIRDLNRQPIEDLVLSEGRVYGARYYCVQPVGGSWLDMETWCLNTFGSCGDSMWGDEKSPEPAQRWYMNNRKFWFRDVKDRDWFILKWR